MLPSVTNVHRLTRARAWPQVYGMYGRVKKYVKFFVKWQIKQKLKASQLKLCFWLETIWSFVTDHAVRCLRAHARRAAFGVA
jgi:hypothetical protein